MADVEVGRAFGTESRTRLNGPPACHPVQPPQQQELGRQMADHPSTAIPNPKSRNQEQTKQNKCNSLLPIKFLHQFRPTSIPAKTHCDAEETTNRNGRVEQKVKQKNAIQQTRSSFVCLFFFTPLFFLFSFFFFLALIFSLFFFLSVVRISRNVRRHRRPPFFPRRRRRRRFFFYA